MQLNYRVLGQRIQKIRKRKHISQASLSAMINKSSGYISYLECGTKVMSLETFVSIANALGVSADTLLQDSLDIMTRPVVTDACLSDHSRALLTDIVGVLREHDVGHG